MEEIKIFERGLKPEFVECLKMAAKEERWWKNILDDPELFIGIRHNYLNVYFHGNSLIKLEYKPGSKNGPLRGTTDKAYLLGSPTGKYAVSKNGVFIDDVKNKNLNDLKSLVALKNKSFGPSNINKKEVHSSLREKTIIQNFLHDHKDVIDLESGISTARYKKLYGCEKYQALGVTRKSPRIDLVQISRTGPVAHLNFVEVKPIDSLALRANSITVLCEHKNKVVQQLCDYRKLLTSEYYETAFVESYQTICRNLLALNFRRYNFEPLRTLIEKIGNGDLLLKVNPKPKLLVLSYKKSELPDYWAKHEPILQEAIHDWCDYEHLQI